MSTVQTHVHDTWMEIVLHRPERRNALNEDMVKELIAALEQAAAPEIRAVLLRGEGPTFCVGGDVKMFAEVVEAGEHIPVEAPHLLHRILRAMRSLEKPILGAVQGTSAGAGVSLMLACDLVIAADSAKFFLAYLSIGTSPDGGSTYFLPRHVGIKKAMELFMGMQPIDANTAQELGLINQITAAADLLEEAQQMTQMIAMGPTLAYAKLKRLLNETGHHTLDQQLDMEAELFSESSKTEDFQEGVRAFTNKRMPIFQGK